MDKVQSKVMQYGAKFQTSFRQVSDTVSDKFQISSNSNVFYSLSDTYMKTCLKLCGLCFSSFSLPQSCGCSTVCHTFRQALCATSVWACAEIRSRCSLTPYSWILPRGASVSSGSLTSCQEVVLVGDGSLVLNSWENILYHQVGAELGPVSLLLAVDSGLEAE